MRSEAQGSCQNTSRCFAFAQRKKKGTNLTVSGRGLIEHTVQKKIHECQIKHGQNSKRGGKTRALSTRGGKFKPSAAVQLGALHTSSFGTQELRGRRSSEAFGASGEVFLIKPRAHCQEEGGEITHTRLNSAC